MILPEDDDDMSEYSELILFITKHCLKDSGTIIELVVAFSLS